MVKQSVPTNASYEVVLMRWDFFSFFLKVKRDFYAPRVGGRELIEFMVKWSNGDLSCELGILFKFCVIIENFTVDGLDMLERYWGHKLRWILKAKMQPEQIASWGKGSTCVSSVTLLVLMCRETRSAYLRAFFWRVCTDFSLLQGVEG